jgi:hypothetical protein
MHNLKTQYDGAGILAEDSDIQIESCNFTKHSAKNGGAIQLNCQKGKSNSNVKQIALISSKIHNSVKTPHRSRVEQYHTTYTDQP